MATWMLDSSGDLAEKDGRPVHVTGAQEIGQRIQVRLKWFYKEWFRNREAGSKWYQYGLGRRNPDLVVLRSMIGLQIRTTAGVVEILSLKVVIDAARGLSITAFVKVDATDATQIRIMTSLIPEPPAPTPEEPPPLEAIDAIQDGELEMEPGDGETDEEPFIEGITLT